MYNIAITITMTVTLTITFATTITTTITITTITMLYYTLLHNTGMYCTGSVCCGINEQKMELDVSNVGYEAVLTTIAAVIIIIWGVIVMRLSVFEAPYVYERLTPGHAEARVGTWFAILVAFLQLTFARVEGAWIEQCCYGREAYSYEEISSEPGQSE